MQVENVDNEFSRLEHEGARFVSTPKDYPNWTIRAVHLRDSDDNLVELFSPIARDRWTEETLEKDRETAVSDH